MALGLMLLGAWLAGGLLLACGGGGGGEPAGDPPLIFGRRGNLPGRFSHPRGIDVTPRTANPGGLIAVADKTGRVQLLDAATGGSHREWFLPRYDNGTPTGIVFDHSQPGTPTLVIADTHYSRILRYALDGTLLMQFGDYGEKPGQMIYPTDAAIGPAGEIYLTEYGLRDRIMVFSREGRFVREWGDFGQKPGQFQRPLALVYTADDRVLVADSCNHRLQWFTPDGELTAIWGEVGKGPGQFSYPYDVAVDGEGRIWVAEYGNNRLQVLDPHGGTLALHGRSGSAPGDLGSPWGIAFHREPDPETQGAIVVADTYNHRLQIFDVDAVLKYAE